jgi:hypothetical protein
MRLGDQQIGKGPPDRIVGEVIQLYVDARPRAGDGLVQVTEIIVAFKVKFDLSGQ